MLEVLLLLLYIPMYAALAMQTISDASKLKGYVGKCNGIHLTWHQKMEQLVASGECRRERAGYACFS